MTFTIVFLAIISSLIFIKLSDISLRNNLDAKSKNRLLIAGALVSLFLITNATLPYTQLLYWIVFVGVLLIGSILCLDILKREALRFKNLKPKDMIMNVLFYSFFIITIHIYL